MPSVLTADEAARRLGVSIRTLFRLKNRGEIPFIALSRRNHVFRELDLEAFLESRRVK